jgi:hypothetical protein
VGMVTEAVVEVVVKLERVMLLEQRSG